jgi:multidrug efflux pump subunit AcrA (membrane-fusion protein)
MQYMARFSFFLVALLLISACARPQQSGATTNEQTLAVQRGTLRVTVGGSGTVQPARSADLAFSATGTISDVLVAEGDTVEQDQELARLDTETLQTQVTTARAQRDAAQAQRDAAQAQRDAAQAHRDRIKEAEEDGNNSRQTVDTSEASKKQADAQIQQAEAQIRQAAAQVDQAEAQLQQAELTLQRATLRAPFAGTVTAVNVAPGDNSSAVGASPTGGSGAPFTVADTSRYHVEANISEADIARIQEGQSAEITIDALGSEPISGTVSYIAPAATVAQNVATYLVRLDVPENVKGLRIGMSASVEINQEEHNNVLLVPNSAIRTEGNRHIVRVKNANGFEDREIQTGLSNDVETEVVGGLNEGDTIAAIGVAQTSE